MSNVTDVKTILTPFGEIIGRITEETADKLVVSNPRLFMVQGDKAGFLPGICQSGNMNPDSIELNEWMCVMDTRSDISDSYIQAVSGIVMP